MAWTLPRRSHGGALAPLRKLGRDLLHPRTCKRREAGAADLVPLRPTCIPPRPASRTSACIPNLASLQTRVDGGRTSHLLPPRSGIFTSSCAVLTAFRTCIRRISLAACSRNKFAACRLEDHPRGRPQPPRFLPCGRLPGIASRDACRVTAKTGIRLPAWRGRQWPPPRTGAVIPVSVARLA